MYFDDPKFPVYTYQLSLINAPETLKGDKIFVTWLRNKLHEVSSIEFTINSDPKFNDEYPDCINLRFMVHNDDCKNIFEKFNLWMDSFRKDSNHNLAKLMNIELTEQYKIYAVWEIDKVFPAGIYKSWQDHNNEFVFINIKLYCSINPFHG